ncbi:MAG: ATP-dependent metallopeptidase FtsH/Yme1/Tma family protein [Bacteroidetes bacterium]|nr:ATP-dependent metallopeptidase FtsH/Yme1/Tma family protein [Bacteroidota bacterium]
MTNSKKPQKPFNFYWIYAIIAVVFIGLHFIPMGGNMQQTNWQDFERKMLQNADIEKIVVVNTELIAEIYIKKEALINKDQYKKVRTKSVSNSENSGPHYYINIGSIDSFEKNLKEAQSNLAENERIGITYDPRKSWGGDALGWLLPIALMIGLWIFIMRRMSGGGGPGGQIFNFGKSKATLFDEKTNVNITFDDVAGLEGAKVEIKEIVDFLKSPKKYTTLGAKIPKGALLVGPPGTGKTLLAKAVAGEAKVPFFSLSGSDFVEMFVGVGASRVRDLFKQAKEKAPCIIFIDEIDAIGRARGKNPMQGSNDERENTLNQLLTEMDGFGTNSGIIVLAATNRADILDSALMRAGRFDRQINVDMPDLNERKSIFEVHIKPLKLDDSVEVDFLAKQTPGFSGADIANLCNEAALIAARTSKDFITKQDFLDAVDRIVGGLENRNKIITPQEKKVIAFHEAGHATVSWLLEHASPLVKVTIVPRGRSLGAAWYLPEERQITTTEQLMDEMCAALGGRAAEEITFGKISTGALSDLEKITKQAYAMTAIYGLNEKIGNISYYDSTGSDSAFTKPYSERTAQVIDEEVSKLVTAAYEKTKAMLTENKPKLEKLAELLLQKEVIFKEDLEEIFGKRPFEKEILMDNPIEQNIPEEETKEEKLQEKTTSPDFPPIGGAEPAIG